VQFRAVEKSLAGQAGKRRTHGLNPDLRSEEGRFSERGHRPPHFSEFSRLFPWLLASQKTGEQSSGMPRPDKIKLYFVKTSQGTPALLKTELETNEGGRKSAIAKESEEPGAFVWNIKKGKLRKFILAVVRAARLIEQEGGESPREPRPDAQKKQESPGGALLFKAERASSETRRCTETQLYDLMAYKECVWLASILSPTDDWMEDAKTRFSRWFVFHNIRGKHSPEPPSIELNKENLPPVNVWIMLDGHTAGPEEVDWIESVLSAHIMPEFPPFLISKRHRTAGYMPSVGPTFGDRDEELRELTSFYSDPKCAFIEIVSESGLGKTALARWWMRQLFRDDSMEQTLVFSWSFPRQSRSDGTRQSLSTFFRTLGKALDVKIEDGLTPQDLVERIFSGMKSVSTFLFLDGIEALLDQLGAFSIGGERCEIADEDMETTFHYDSLRLLLREIVAATDKRLAFLLVTTRQAIGRTIEASSSSGHLIHLKPYPGFAYSDVELEREGQYDPANENEALGEALSGELKAARRRKASKREEGGLGGPFASFQEAEVTQRLRYLVRRNVDRFGISPERCLLYVASCFDQDADWDAVMHVIRSEEGGGEITSQWRGLTDIEWGDVSENLLEANLTQPAGGGYISFHPGVQQCVYDDFRKNMAESCFEVHRRLYAYFFKIPKREQPETVEEMQPLFRACWHGCNAGDFKKTFDEVAYTRLSRKWEAYILFTLCEYEESIQVLNLFTEDGETFPASDLDEATRTTIVQGCALALRYVDRLNEAYRVEKFAWMKSMALPSKPQLPAIASNLLRLHHMFGDLGKDASPVLWSLLRGVLPKIGATAQKEEIPKTFIPQAVGYMAGIAALVQALRGNTQKARLILAAAWKSSKMLGSKNHYVMPEMGAVHHALALLELGQWEMVLKAQAAGELDAAVARYKQTGAISYIKGRALSNTSTQEQVQLKALGLVEECLRKAKGNFKWWSATASHEIGQIYLRLKRVEPAKTAFGEALKIATARKNQFKLIEVDSRLGLAECEALLNNEAVASSHAKKALARLDECGYGARRRAAQRFLQT